MTAIKSNIQPSMHKEEARKYFKVQRQALSSHQLEELSLHIANQCLSLPLWDKAFFHLFLSITRQKEVNTEYLLHILQGKDKNVVIAKTDFSTLQMKHFLLTDTTQIKVNSFGIPEPIHGIAISPQQIDVVFVPLLAGDTQGNRVGYGKGFYDQFLSECKQEVVKVGLSFFEPISLIEGITSHDQKLDYLVTPNASYRF